MESNHHAAASQQPMRRQRSPAILFAGVLAFATGIALGVTATTVTGPATSSAPEATMGVEVDDGAARRVADRFYAALNATLASGDSGALARVVDSRFVDHTDQDGSSSGWQALRISTLTIRDAQPSLRLTMTTAVVDGDRVMVYLHAESSARIIDTVEVLRLAGGRVAERWGLVDLEVGALAITPTPVLVFVTVPPVLLTIPPAYLPLFATETALAGGTVTPGD